MYNKEFDVKFNVTFNIAQRVKSILL